MAESVSGGLWTGWEQELMTGAILELLRAVNGAGRAPVENSFL